VRNKFERIFKLFLCLKSMLRRRGAISPADSNNNSPLAVRSRCNQSYYPRRAYGRHSAEHRQRIADILIELNQSEKLTICSSSKAHVCAPSCKRFAIMDRGRL